MKFIASLVCALMSAPLAAQQTDPQLLAEINRIKAIDNHSHPPKLVAPGEKDDDFDALPCDPLEQAPMPAKIREDNPNFIAAWKALYGYRYNDASPEHIKELLAAKQRARAEQGENFPNWVLDQLGIETEFANRVAMGRGLQPPRFRWVPFDDALLFPLVLSTSVSLESPDRAFFFMREENLLTRYFRELHLTELPATLDEYTSKVITALLESQKRNGAVAIKFEAAYLRSLDFGPSVSPGPEAAALGPIYAKAKSVKGKGEGIATDAEYRRLQNYLFRYIAREAGRLKLPVHFHSAAGCGTYFQLAGANPLNMESVFNDPSLRDTTFVIIHGGWPFTKEAAAMMMKPNVWVDFSEQTWLLSPRQIAESLRTYLEWYPEKVLFGTDLYPGSPEIDWEEIGWVTTNDARRALAIALTGMIEDGVITRERALQIAHMALHDNAAKLYGLGAAK